MDKTKFKRTFGRIAKDHGFEFLFGGWFKESDECIVALELQKSSYSSLYYLNIKIYIQRCFCNRYSKSKFLVKREIGNISRRHLKEYDISFDFDTEMDEDLRVQGFERLFTDFVEPFTEKALSLEGIKELEKRDLIWIPPGTRESLSEFSEFFKQ